eukprot:TRINITY_DN15020_c0_g1_i1.p1 TRINITY_DN15020_c0_g1~~TRINITY_DN15020_c0_g1_i1.p1  ORF type:complete len:330 (-),score=73.56 TRINITY_DN15020_c0_g1_i1:514-1503(-)
MLRSLVGSEMCIRDSINAEYGGPCSRPMSNCLPGGKIGYDRINEGNAFAATGPANNYTIDNEPGAGSYQDSVKLDTMAPDSFGSVNQPGASLPPSQSEYPQSDFHTRPHMAHTSANIFAACCPGKSGLTANTVLMVLLCAAEVGSSMAIGSLVLLTDFFRRLSCVFLLIYDMEALQLEEDLGGSPDVRIISHRGNLLSKAMIGVYLLSASFFMATFALWRMYGHDPPQLDSPGWLILFGVLGVSLDVLHVFCGVNQTLVHDDIELSRFWWCFLQAYGSLIVLFEGLVASMSGGSFLDPIVAIIFAALMCIGNMGPVLASSAELYNRLRA